MVCVIILFQLLNMFMGEIDVWNIELVSFKEMKIHDLKTKIPQSDEKVDIVSIFLWIIWIEKIHISAVQLISQRECLLWYKFQLTRCFQSSQPHHMAFLGRCDDVERVPGSCDTVPEPSPPHLDELHLLCERLILMFLWKYSKSLKLELRHMNLSGQRLLVQES